MNLFKKLFKISSLKSIDKNIVTEEIKNNNELGVTKEKRETKLIVSVTSFPQRMYDIHYGLYSLLNQSVKPDEVVLWLGKEQFPNLEGDLPETLLSLKEKGLSIKWSTNLFSYTKLVPSLNEYPNSIIVTADDDIYYEKNWLEKLYNEHKENPANIVCHRAHKIKLNNDKNKNTQITSYKKWPKKISDNSTTYKNFLTGVGGVLYPPNCLFNKVTDIELFTKLAPKADDVWFWAMAVLNSTKIKVVKNNITDLTYVNPERERGLTGELTLFASNRLGGNDVQIQKVIEEFPEIMDILLNE